MVSQTRSSRQFALAILGGIAIILAAGFVALLTGPESPVAAILVLFSFFFAGLFAGRKGPRPVLQGALAAALGGAILMKAANALAPPLEPEAEVSMAAPGLLFAAALVGIAAAKLSTIPKPAD
ncbi:MAG: hypothetical protein JXO22_16390 [Phycisphaerae bacterium]|nr:hypothetical protein [Phycisphaerae bacterium]